MIAIILMKTIFLSILTTFLFLSQAYSQKKANIWYFGGYAGLDFSNGSPVPLTNGQMDQHEGCATISDSTGNLLFYTNGIDVWNKRHEKMQNGYGLMGGQSSAQSSIIVQLPKSDSIYFIFTVPEEIGYNGLRYSIVDISKNGGLGSVIQKNIFLVSPAEEKVMAVKHQNNEDIWLITHLWNSSEFYSYLLTSEGIDQSPIVSNIGSYHFGPDVHGTMKVSPNGKKIALVQRGLESIELFDFDNKTGEITNYLPFQSTMKLAYGIEFSQDGSLLYVGDYYNRSTITQFDLNAGTNDEIIQSGIEIGSVSNIHLGALQMAPDGKIYIAKHNNLIGDDYLGIIEYPELRGVDCNFEEDGLFLNGRVCYWGLPTFVQSYFSPKQNITCTNTCFGNITHFTPTNTQNIDSVLWHFGDSNNSSSTEIYSQHLYSEPGDYVVTLSTYFHDFIDETYLNITIYPGPGLEIGFDSIEITDDYVILDAGPGFNNYLWNDNSTGQTMRAYDEGLYWVKATLDECSSSDSVMVYKKRCQITAQTLLTPNGDGIDDFYHVITSAELTQFDISIYNLWGVEIFNSSDPYFTWNGTWKGTPVPSGAYVYRIYYTCSGTSQKQLLTGHLEVFH